MTGDVKAWNAAATVLAHCPLPNSFDLGPDRRGSCDKVENAKKKKTVCAMLLPIASCQAVWPGMGKSYKKATSFLIHTPSPRSKSKIWFLVYNKLLP